MLRGVCNTKNSILEHVLIHVGEEASLSLELMDTKGSAIFDLDVIVILLYIIFGSGSPTLTQFSKNTVF